MASFHTHAPLVAVWIYEIQIQFTWFHEFHIVTSGSREAHLILETHLIIGG